MSTPSTPPHVRSRPHQSSSLTPPFPTTVSQTAPGDPSTPPPNPNSATSATPSTSSPSTSTTGSASDSSSPTPPPTPLSTLLSSTLPLTPSNLQLLQQRLSETHSLLESERVRIRSLEDALHDVAIDYSDLERKLDDEVSRGRRLQGVLKQQRRMLYEMRQRLVHAPHGGTGTGTGAGMGEKRRSRGSSRSVGDVREREDELLGDPRRSRSQSPNKDAEGTGGASETVGSLSVSKSTGSAGSASTGSLNGKMTTSTSSPSNSPQTERGSAGAGAGAAGVSSSSDLTTSVESTSRLRKPSSRPRSSHHHHHHRSKRESRHAEQLERLQGDNRRLRGNLADSTKRIMDLESRIVETSKEKLLAEQKLVKLQTSSRRFSKKISTLTKERDDARRKLGRRSGSRSKAANARSSRRDRDLAAKISRLETEKEVLKQQIGRLERRAPATEVERPSSLDSVLRSRIISNRRSPAADDQDLMAMTRERDTLVQRRNELQSELSEVRSDAVELAKQVKKFAKVIQDDRQAIRILHRKNRELADRLDSSSEIDGLKRENLELKTKLEFFTDAQHRTAVELASAKSDILLLKESEQNLKRELFDQVALSTDLREHLQELQTVHRDLGSANEHLSSVRAALAISERSRSRVTQEASNERMRAAELATELNQARSEHKTAVSALQTKMDALSRECEVRLSERERVLDDTLKRLSDQQSECSRLSELSESQMKGSASQVVALKERLSIEQEQRSELLVAAKDRHSEISRLRSENQGLVADRDAARESCHSLEGRVSELSDLLAAAEKRVLQSTQDVAVSLALAEEGKITAEKKLESVAARNSELSENLTSVTVELERANERLALHAEDRLEGGPSAEEEHDRLKDLNQSLSSDNRRIGLKLASVVKKYDTLIALRKDEKAMFVKRMTKERLRLQSEFEEERHLLHLRNEGLKKQVVEIGEMDSRKIADLQRMLRSSMKRVRHLERLFETETQQITEIDKDQE